VPLGAQERHHCPCVGEKAAMVKIRRSVIGRRKERLAPRWNNNTA
jgi:hypothetical protein